MRRVAPRFGILVTVPLALALAVPSFAGDTKPSSDLLTKARLRAAVYLRGVKQIRAEGLAGNALVPERRAETIAGWKRIAGIPMELDRLRATALKSRPKTEAEASAREIASLLATVRRIDAAYRPILGEPPSALAVPPPGPPRGAVTDGRAYFVTGQLTARGGSAAFRPHENPAGDQDAGTLDFQVRGGMSPDEKTNVSIALARSRRVEQIAVANTEISARADRAMSSRLQASAEAGYRGYGEDDADARDYGEARLRTSSRYALAGATALEAAYGYDRRRHAETSVADFSSHRLDAALRHRTDGLRFESALSIQRRSAGDAGGSFTRREPTVLLETGGGATGIAAGFETYGYDEAPALDSRRMKIDAYTGRGIENRYGAGYVRFDRPEMDAASPAAGYDDVTLYHRARSATARRSGSRETALTYRAQRSDAAADFVNVLWNRTTCARGSWLARRELHLTTRYFLNTDSAPTEQHQADLAFLAGWDLAGPAETAIGIDASAGGLAFIDPDRASHQDFDGGDVYDPNEPNNFDPDDDDAWKNPRNTLRLGGAARVSRRSGPGLTFDASVKAERHLHYNADPATSRTDVGFDVQARHPIGPAWLAEGAVSLFRSRSSQGGSAADFTRSSVQLGVTYLFSFSGGPGR